jgi:phosphonate degradation associated HDIG domain protein
MISSATNPQATVEQLFALYQAHGADDYIGEPVSQLEHMWQAATLAEAEGCEEEAVLAAFFHDIGHLCAHGSEACSMDGYGTVDHEKLGADYLRVHGFSERMARLVESHVLAKRYLAHRYPSYLSRLSEASLATLAFQGGVMTTAEAAAFEQDPDADLIIRLRLCDERAKEANLPTGSLDYFKNMALRHLQNQQATPADLARL